MRALVTNDDGVDALGIRVLTRAAVAAGLQVTVAAPHQERSGSGTGLAGLVERGRIVVARHEWEDVEGAEVLAVEATPALIGFVGGHGAFDEVPHVVLSGVNHGSNAGPSVLHSGTVGAAMSAASVGIPSLAVSIKGVNASQWETAAHATTLALKWFLENADSPYVLNVNIPDVPLEEFRGLRAGGLASVGTFRAMVAERGEGFVQMSFGQADVDPEPGTDVDLMQRGWASVTALRPPFAAADDIDLSGLA